MYNEKSKLNDRDDGKMGDYQNLNQIGEEIKDALEDALNTLDFSGLNKTISDTVNGAIHEVRKQFGNVVAGNTERSPETERSAGSPEYRSKVKVPREIKAKQQAKETGLRVIRQRPVGQISSVLYTVFGGVGAGITGVCAIICGALAAAGISGFFIGLGISLPLLAVSVGMLGKGSVQRGRLERFRRYLKACGDKTYCDIKLLAAGVGRSVGYVRKDLKKMLQLNMLPEGHLDDKGTCLMLDDATYRQYLETRQSYGARGDGKASVNETLSGAEGQAREDERLYAMVQEGQEYIEKLRKLNDAIPGEVFSDKLSRLERVLTEIFDALKARPEKQPQMRKFMDYYLPTTLKLVEAYAEFDGVQIQGENIKAAKLEIEKTMDTINRAFEKLLDELFQDAAFDAATDAQVLQTLLAQEGLAADETFKDACKS